MVLALCEHVLIDLSSLKEVLTWYLTREEAEFEDYKLFFMWCGITPMRLFEITCACAWR